LNGKPACERKAGKAGKEEGREKQDEKRRTGGKDQGWRGQGFGASPCSC
jgi:hypothetical protein